MAVGRNNGVVGLTGFSDKKMSGLLFGRQKRGLNNGVVVLTGWSYGGVPQELSVQKSLVSNFPSKSLESKSTRTPSLGL